MVTYQQISILRKYVKVTPHAVDQYRTRVNITLTAHIAEQKLINAYLRGDPLNLSSGKSLKQAFRYLDTVSYYKYGNLVIVVKEYGPRYEECEKIILTCYRYRKSKFDPSITT